VNARALVVSAREALARASAYGDRWAATDDDEAYAACWAEMIVARVLAELARLTAAEQDEEPAA